MRTRSVRNRPYVIPERRTKEEPMFLNHDLAKAILDDRRAQARKAGMRHKARSEARAPVIEEKPDQADVIELVFGSHCASDQIGA